jgi:hypothetical protein
MANSLLEAYEMRELNPIGREGDSLLLVTNDGERFSLNVDEALVRTIKEHRVPDTNVSELSPRQIQDAIRSGASVKELAENSGTSLDLIERFAHPVLEELAHIVELAKSVRVEQPADRFNEVPKRQFGELIEEQLSQSKATEIRWSAKRGTNAIWEITVSFASGGETGVATWTFDPRKYLLTPETANAASLSSSGNKLDNLLGPTTLQKHAKPVSVKEAVEVISEDNLLAFRSRRIQAQEIVPEVLELKEISPEVPEEIAAAEPGPSGSEEQGPAPAAESTNDSEESKPIEPKKVRAPMPSWDQIVRGTQSDDGEAF